MGANRQISAHRTPSTVGALQRDAKGEKRKLKWWGKHSGSWRGIHRTEVEKTRSVNEHRKHVVGVVGVVQHVDVE